MIIRLWRGEAATPAKAHAYFEHVTGTVFPALKAIAGHIDAWLLRREVEGRTEFLAMTLWTSLEAIQAFSGCDIGVAVVEPEGGRVTVGGSVPEGLDRGYFVAPTVVADVAPDHTVFQEEVFGPVLSITPYDGGDDGAVELANNSTYGLAGGIHGSDERAMAVARRIRTGSLMINSGMYYGADAPFGGYKMSGIGRQNGIEGFEQHLQTKTIGYPLEQTQ